MKSRYVMFADEVWATTTLDLESFGINHNEMMVS